jgi:hypothetical protein
VDFEVLVTITGSDGLIVQFYCFGSMKEFYYLCLFKCNFFSFYSILENLRVCVDRKVAIWCLQWLHFGLIFSANTLLSFVYNFFFSTPKSHKALIKHMLY